MDPLSSHDHAERRQRMVDEQIAERGVRDEAVLAAMRAVPRHLFVPPGLASEAYRDNPLPIGHGQTISQPYMVALMTALLELDVRSRVLEVGTGSGYQTAVLAELAGEVFPVVRSASLAEAARVRLAELGYHNVTVSLGDGSMGLPEQAPFDAIVVTAAAPAAPPALLEQLVEDGRLVVPLGSYGGGQTLTVLVRHGEEHEARPSVRCRFVPLIGEQGVPEAPTDR
jgi:protein-L-isoaspartate(D-aspartate) O-methyltransferase